MCATHCMNDIAGCDTNVQNQFISSSKINSRAILAINQRIIIILNWYFIKIVHFIAADFFWSFFLFFFLYSLRYSVHRQQIRSLLKALSICSNVSNSTYYDSSAKTTMIRMDHRCIYDIGVATWIFNISIRCCVYSVE